MTNATCTLNGQPAMRATVVLPRWGVWTADVQVSNMLDVSGAVTIALADLELKGTVVDGGPYATRGWYRIVGGAGGWRKALKPLPYRSEAGVKMSTIFADAAKEVGETLGTFKDRRVGPAFMRAPSLAGDGMSVEAARVLDEFAPEAWYVDLDGTTQIGVRAAKKFTTEYRLLEKRPELRRALIASDTLADLVPGAQLEGLEAATIRHELTEQSLRTHVYGVMGKTASDRAWHSLARIVRALTVPLFYTGRFEYQVDGGSGGYLDLRPVNRSLGLPPLGNVPMRVGIMGGRGTPAKGSTVLVGFINFDPTRPYCESYVGETGADSVPTECNVYADSMKFGDAGAVKVARGDKMYEELGKISTAIAGVGGTYTVPVSEALIETSKVSLS